MSDYKLTRDAAGKVTTQYGQMLQNLEDDLVKRARHNALADMPHYASVELIEAMADRIEELEAKLEKAVEVLEFYTYETTHLSSEEDDGSHWCKISKGCLAQARAAIAELKGQ